MEWSGVERSGVEWSEVELSGVKWSGVKWSGVKWSGVECDIRKISPPIDPKIWPPMRFHQLFVEPLWGPDFVPFSGPVLGPHFFCSVVAFYGRVVSTPHLSVLRNWNKSLCVRGDAAGTQSRPASLRPHPTEQASQPASQPASHQASQPASQPASQALS